jgi:mannose-6-phosphate isomerase-like protein (cupin superfamily)
MAGVIISSIDGLSRVRDIHGGKGEIQVKRLATGNMMYADWDAFEFAELPPGTGAGTHVHTRTEELFFVLAGHAIIGLGDEKVEVGPGEVILTPFMGVQSVQAIGDEPYKMLVIEALPPEIVQGLPSHSPSAEVQK